MWFATSDVCFRAILGTNILQFLVKAIVHPPCFVRGHTWHRFPVESIGVFQNMTTHLHHGDPVIGHATTPSLIWDYLADI